MRMGQYGRATAALATIVLAALLLKDAPLASEAVSHGLSLCARTMIPSLFPFMVVAELTVRTGAGRWLARASAWLLRPLLRISEAGCSAVVLGALCGFPVGARTAASYHRRGEMTEEEFLRVMCFCNLPSAAYLVGAVGISLFASAGVGRALIGLSYVSALLVGLVLRPIGRVETTARTAARTEASGGLPDAIRAAADGMMGVCATVLLFSALGGVVGRYLDAWGVGTVGRAALTGLLELSTGAVASAACEGDAGLLLVAAAVGWGGLSVHCQIVSVCEGCPRLSVRFWLARLAQAVLCALGMWCLITVGAVERGTDAGAMRPVLLWASGELAPDASGVWCVAWVAVFVLVCFWRAVSVGRDRYGKKTRA